MNTRMLNTRFPLLAASALAAVALLAGCGQTVAADSDTERAPARAPLRITSLCSAPDYVLAQAPEGLCDGPLVPLTPTQKFNDNDPRMLHGGAPTVKAPDATAPTLAPAAVDPAPEFPCSPEPGFVPRLRGMRITC